MKAGEDARIRIVPLGDRPDAVPLLAEWFHTEWATFDGRSRAEIASQLRQNLRSDGIPITFLALREESVLGTISLDISDLPSHDHLTPWLASLYVIPEARRQGIAAALICHLLAFAHAHALPRIHLWTPGSTALYEKLGWRLLERSISGGQPIQIMVREAA